MLHDDTIRGHASAWAVRVGDPTFEDWDAFTNWLEEDPEHARAYDAVAMAVADAADVIGHASPAANDDGPARFPVRRRWAIGVLAASLAVVATAGLTLLGSDRYIVETAPGEMRTVALSDGGSVVLAGGTRIELDRDDDRFARLELGQALFTVHHDEERPFAVMAGDDRLVDAGTVFEVELDATKMQVAVSEGLVLFNPGKQDVPVAPGRMLTKRRGAAAYALSSVTPDQVGEWRSGRLSFDNAPLGLVAARLSRMTGIAFEAEAGTARAFSGSVLIAPLRNDPQSLGALLGTTVRREGDRWIIMSN